METYFKRPFSQYVKKAARPLQLAIEDAVEEVCANPMLGEMKTGDLAGVRVYKFRFNRQEYLLGYVVSSRGTGNADVAIDFFAIDFYQVGSHENFYGELKRYIKLGGNIR